MPSKAQQYDLARVAMEALYPKPYRLRSMYTTGCIESGSVSVGRERRCEIRLEGQEVAISEADALRLAQWLIENYSDMSAALREEGTDGCAADRGDAAGVGRPSVGNRPRP